MMRAKQSGSTLCVQSLHALMPESDAQARKTYFDTDVNFTVGMVL